MRLFWMAVGAAGMWWVMVRGRAMLRRVTPDSVADQVEEQGRRAAEALAHRYDTYRTAQRQREAELRDQLNITR